MIHQWEENGAEREQPPPTAKIDASQSYQLKNKTKQNTNNPV